MVSFTGASVHPFCPSLRQWRRSLLRGAAGASWRQVKTPLLKSTGCTSITGCTRSSRTIETAPVHPYFTSLRSSQSANELGACSFENARHGLQYSDRLDAHRYKRHAGRIRKIVFSLVLQAVHSLGSVSMNEQMGALAVQMSKRSIAERVRAADSRLCCGSPSREPGSQRKCAVTWACEAHVHLQLLSSSTLRVHLATSPLVTRDTLLSQSSSAAAMCAARASSTACSKR